MMPTPEIFPYTLHGRTALNARHAGHSVSGVLVRSGGGFACLQAWESLGDDPLAVHVESLAGGNPSSLASRAIVAAAMDAVTRAAGQSLFDGLVIPASHATITGPINPALAESWIARGFDTFKMKLGPEWPVAMPGIIAAAAAHPQARWRFDFNASVDAIGFSTWARSLPDTMRATIDFVEDPCLFSPGAWAELEESTSLRLAADAWCCDPAAAGFIGICKPARDDAQAVLDAAVERKRPMVVTSNMDHSVGVAWAAVWAARFAAAGVQHGPAGLCTPLLFEPDAFSERFGPEGNRLRPPGGSGIGFDDLLAGLPWRGVGAV